MLESSTVSETSAMSPNGRSHHIELKLFKQTLIRGLFIYLKPGWVSQPFSHIICKTLPPCRFILNRPYKGFLCSCFTSNSSFTSLPAAMGTNLSLARLGCDPLLLCPSFIQCAIKSFTKKSPFYHGLPSARQPSESKCILPHSLHPHIHSCHGALKLCCRTRFCLTSARCNVDVVRLNFICPIFPVVSQIITDFTFWHLTRILFSLGLTQSAKWLAD